MSFTISVLQPLEKIDIINNKTEQEILYENFQKQASIPEYHFKLFMEMHNSYKPDINTNIPSILIKKILPYFIPIIKEIPNKSVKKKHVEIYKKTIVEVKTNDYYNISTQLDKPILCKFEHETKSRYITIPKNTTFLIIGLELSSIKKHIDNSFPNYLLSIDIIKTLKTGNFGLIDFQHDIYTQSRIDDINTKIKIKDSSTYFTDDKDALTQIGKLSIYINYINNYYEDNYLMVYKYIEQSFFKSQIRNEIKNYNIFNVKNDHVNIKKNNIISLIEKITHSKIIGDDYYVNFMMSIFNLTDMYNKLKILGLENPINKKYIQYIHTKNKYNDANILYGMNKFKQLLEYAKKKSISINKFNISDMNKLNETQKEIINLEFIKSESHNNNYKKYATEFDVVNSLFYAISIDSKFLISNKLDEISQIVKIPAKIEDEIKMIQINNKISLICPHVIFKARKMVDTYKTDLLKNGTIRIEIIDKFALYTDDGYYCKICGELLAELDDDELLKYIAGKRVSFTIDNDILKIKIWKDVVQILTTFIKFKYPTNINKIASSITDILRGEMGYIESNFYKIKSNSKDNINHLITLYTVIYTYAVISHMIINNYGKIAFSIKPPIKSKKIGGRVKKTIIDNKSPIIEYKKDKSPVLENKVNKSIMQNIINNAFYMIIKTQNVLINKINNISDDSIKNILLKAYRWISSTTSQSIIDNNIIEDDHDKIKHNIIYQYASYIKSMHDHNNIKKEDVTKNIHNYSIKDIMGRDINTIISDAKNNKSIYETIIIPKPFASDENSKYIYDSFVKTIEYIKNQLYNKPIIPISIFVKEHDDKYKYLIDIENKMVQNYYLEYARPLITIPILNYMTDKINNFKVDNIKIEKYYDNNGIKHIFNTYIYQKYIKGTKSGSVKEYTRKDIELMLSTNNVKLLNELKYSFIVDKKCSVCDVLLSNVKNKKNIEKILNEKININTFFTHYENRCPNGELHDFYDNKNNTCKKCNITQKIIETHDLKFYNKYYNKFKQVYSDKTDTFKKYLNNVNIVNKLKNKQDTYTKWKINNSTVLELSRVFNIKYNILINLGLSYNIKYQLIESEKINPHIDIPDDILTVRNNTLYGYYLKVVRIYNQIRHYNILDNIPYDLKNIMASNTVVDLDKILPNLDNTILKKYTYYIETDLSCVVSNFLLYSICDSIVNIYNNLIKNSINKPKDICNYIIDSIIISEKLVSEPNITIIKDDSNEYTEDLTNDLNDDQDLELDYNDKSLEDLNDDDFQPDDFSTADLDMDDADEENFENHHDY